MKAVVIHATGGPEQLTLADMPDPVPSAGEVLIDVAYAGCNWADTQVRMGIYPHAMTYPMVLGFEVAGTVAALGPDVSGFTVGERVAAFPEKGGAYAEKCLAGAAGLIKLPDAVGLDIGAAFPIQALTAYHMMWTIYGGVGQDDTVLVNAVGGGVGLMCTQLAVHAGARVIGTTGTPGKYWAESFSIGPTMAGSSGGVLASGRSGGTGVTVTPASATTFCSCACTSAIGWPGKMRQLMLAPARCGSALLAWPPSSSVATQVVRSIEW